MAKSPSKKKLSPHERFVRALQHQSIPCGQAGCPGPVEVTDLSQARDRVKSFRLHCERCGREDRLSGREQLTPPWDDASILVMADKHLMHQEPTCPFDGTPIVFTSLPSPRRKARYRLSCFSCGRQTEVDWPPPESRR